MKSGDSLIALAAALGAAEVRGLSRAEIALLVDISTADRKAVTATRRLIRTGGDPLGELFSKQRSPEERRPLGATYTPGGLVAAMVEWAAVCGEPSRVVDPGVGSGRFLLAAARRFPKARLIGVDIDPLAALMARANLAAAGFADRAEIHVADYRSFRLPTVPGRTLFIGNPPYVRHHRISSRWKAWLTDTARREGHRASQLAGLHVYFFLATARHAKPGDIGAFVTAAEWLDVNYGRLVRDLLLNGLGGQAVLMIAPTARPFADAASTAAITTFEVGSRPASIRLRTAHTLNLTGVVGTGTAVPRARLLTEDRWARLSRHLPSVPSGHVELGELCRVHRGCATGANKVWIAAAQSPHLPATVLFPAITKARELFAVDDELSDGGGLRQVIDLPADLDVLNAVDREAASAFLQWARAMGADRGYIARHRRAWWAVGLRPPPPILATYMARRPPAFVRNTAGVRYLNIAHGLYPREPMTPAMLTALVRYLRRSTDRTQGRTYAGGLTKFEPREMERIIVPQPSMLLDAGPA